MITKEQALTCRYFHENFPRPGGTCYTWRRNGATKTWKSKGREHEFRIPVKFGMRSYGYITHLNAKGYHVEEECRYRQSTDDNGVGNRVSETQPGTGWPVE